MFKNVLFLKKLAIIVAVMFVVSLGSVLLSLNPIEKAASAEEKFVYGSIGTDKNCAVSEKEFLEDVPAKERKIFATVELDYPMPDYQYDRNDYDTIEEAEAAYEVYKKKMGDYFTEKNNLYINKLGLDKVKKDYAASERHYSPHISFDLTEKSYSAYKTAFERAAQSDTVKKVYINDNLAKIDNALFEDKDSRLMMFYTSALENIDVYDTYVSGSNTGQGIKVGIIEGYVPKTYHVNFENTDIHTIGSSGPSGEIHATAVASILGGDYGIASGASLYCAALKTYSFIDALNYMVNNSVKVVNLSCSGSSGYYVWTSGIIDYYVRYYYLTLVASVGNEVYATDLAIANNVISVGSNSSYDLLSYFSAYINPYGYALTPTLVAPGKIEHIPNFLGIEFEGTSFSAPFVTGCIALMMKEDSTLINNPAKVKAKVTCSAVAMISSGQLDLVGSGAGIFNYSKAHNLAVLGLNFTNKTNNPGAVKMSQPIIVVEGTRYKVSFSWLANSTTSSDSSTYTQRCFTNYKMNLKNSSGTIIATSNRPFNLEFIVFDSAPSPFLQIYTVEIIQVGAKYNNWDDLGYMTYCIAEQ